MDVGYYLRVGIEVVMMVRAVESQNELDGFNVVGLVVGLGIGDRDDSGH